LRCDISFQRKRRACELLLIWLSLFIVFIATCSYLLFLTSLALAILSFSYSSMSGWKRKKTSCPSASSKKLIKRKSGINEFSVEQARLVSKLAFTMLTVSYNCLHFSIKFPDWVKTRFELWWNYFILCYYRYYRHDFLSISRG